MSERLFGRPDVARKSVVREGRSDRGALTGQRGGEGQRALEGPVGIAGMLKPYKTYIILGVAMLAVAIAYQLYSRRASQKKTEEQVAAGLSAIEHQQQGGSGRPPLQVDPQVIEVLQNQVHSYQEQVAELEEALSRSNQQMRQLLASRAAPQMDPVAAQMMATRTQEPQQAPPEYSGLHGQMPPQSFPSGLSGQGGPMGGSVQMGQGMPGAYAAQPHPSQMPPPPNQQQGGPGGPMGGGMNFDPRMNMQGQGLQNGQQGQQGVGMGAFASGGGGGEPMPAIGGMSGHMGGSDFTPLPQGGSFGDGPQGGHGASPGARMNF